MDAFVGEIRAFPFDLVPQGWMACDGSLYQIQIYPALFAILGTVYGGDGKTTFAVPNLQGQAAIGTGTGPGLSTYEWGQTVGTTQVVMDDDAQLPAHTHQANALTTTQLSGDYVFPMPVKDSVFTNFQTIKNNKVTAVQAYYKGTQPNPAALNRFLLFIADGGGQAHENRQPYLPMHFCINVTGTYPQPD